MFIAPHGARDLAVDAGARNLLIGLGQSHGVTGDFELEVLNPGVDDLKLGARFYDIAQRGYGITHTGDLVGKVQLPDHTRMIIDVDGGRYRSRRPPPLMVQLVKAVNSTSISVAQPSARLNCTPKTPVLRSKTRS